jgi:hypothetical protein
MVPTTYDGWRVQADALIDGFWADCRQCGGFDSVNTAARCLPMRNFRIAGIAPHNGGSANGTMISLQGSATLACRRAINDLTREIDEGPFITCQVSRLCG